MGNVNIMRFRAHDTFFIRKGWLSKGIRNVQKDPSVFMGKNGSPMDILGIGSNMVKALRYWLQAVGLTIETTVNGRRSQMLTPFGELVAKFDPYIEELGTLWLLHYKLAINQANATAWYYFFNEFRLSEFTKEDFVSQLVNYVHSNGEKIAEKSLMDDYNCIINTYLPRAKLNPEKIQPENNIDCPLGELNLIDIVNKKEHVYKKVTPKKDAIHPFVFLAVIVDQAQGQKEIRISHIQNGLCNVGRVFNLDTITLLELLHRVELLGYIKIIRTAGLDIIRIEKNVDFLSCVQNYYLSINSQIFDMGIVSC
jgi:hypothetical protein